VTEEQIALARRAVACKGWRWMGGMLRVSPVLEKAFFDFHPDVMPTERVLDQHPSTDADKRWSNATNAWVQLLPDLTDPATLGCLLALVREACGDDEAYAIPWHDEDGGWTVCVREEDRSVNVSEGDTEAEALVAALEDAP
jgi:hypothetical protein